jgi:hypothetical protein
VGYPIGLDTTSFTQKLNVTGGCHEEAEDRSLMCSTIVENLKFSFTNELYCLVRERIYETRPIFKLKLI